MNLSMSGAPTDFEALCAEFYKWFGNQPMRCQHLLQRDERAQKADCERCALLAKYEAAVKAERA